MGFLSRDFLDRLGERRCIACNNSWELTDCEILYFGDTKWWDKVWGNRQKVEKQFDGVVCTSALSSLKMGLKVKHIRRVSSVGIDKRPDYLRWNHNTGMSAINIAYHLGATKIVLLGFDMRTIKGMKNYHNDHKEMPESEKNMKKRFELHMNGVLAISRDAKKYGVEIYNATPGSAIPERFFPIIPPEEGLKL